MGVASIPEHKDQQPRPRDQRSRDEWTALETPSGKMDLAKSGPDEFVTVVSVGNQPNAENFVTVLSIGNSNKKEEDVTASSVATAKSQTISCAEGYLEEEVEVYRLPGERLGFGLKFEGGNKTSERVRRLFVQSCAEQSPASRAKCSWGTLGEGDEVLSIDGVPVSHMTRLDCVRRLKESQLVIKLTVRCRGALRPEVVSAERKTPPERSKIPPELPSAPPPVPPRKLRQQSRGLADGEANPCPVTRSWDRAKAQNGMPHGQSNASNKTAAYENCDPTKYHNSPLKDSANERSPVPQKSKQEPPEAMVYLDARSQCGSTHGSTSDDTGSSMSTVVDRFSTSDRVSTISTVSTASITSEHQSNDCPTFAQECDDSENDLSRTVCPFDHLEREFQTSPPDYLLRRLANSEAVTHVESRGEVERITAVVAPNTVLIEETITLQPPLSFQDAPLSYGHEPRPDLFYAADLAADSTTHFRPIKDDAALVERVNGDLQEDRCEEVQRFSGSVPVKATAVKNDRKDNGSVGAMETGRTPPPLPARNHVNRISVNQQPDSGTQFSQQSAVAKDSTTSQRPAAQDVTKSSTVDIPSRQDVPILPPKPLPRRDVRRKRLPPPPPPPITPRREPRTNPSTEKSLDDDQGNTGSPNKKTTDSKDTDKSSPNKNLSKPQDQNMRRSSSTESSSENSESPCRSKSYDLDSDASSPPKKNDEDRDDADADNKFHTNKVLEIIEIRKARALSPQSTVAQEENRSAAENGENSENPARSEATRKSPEVVASGSPGKRSLKCVDSVSTDCEGTETDDCSDDLRSEKQKSATSEDDSASYKEAIEIKDEGPAAKGKRESDDDDDDEDDDGTYKSLDEVKDDIKNSDVNGTSDEDDLESDSTDDSDDGRCCWQSHLATIGEEEENNSLEYTNANNDTSESRAKTAVKPEPVTPPTREKDARHKNGSVNDRMDNCGGGQRLPPDGDEFPAAYQEFTNEQQYQYTTVGRPTAAMTSNDNHDCNEIESYAANNDFISTKTVLVNVESISSEERNVDSVAESKTNSYKVSESVGKKNNTSQNIGHYPAYQASNSNVVVFEKKIETVRYYQKDNTPQFRKDLASETELINRLGNDGASTDAPPPLPLTGPPKIEQLATGHARNLAPVVGTQQQRKFSLNGELRRQDDKSEKSVRDKIAMFSSKDHLEAPLFPSNTVVSSSGRRLSKYRSSDDVCNDEKNTGQKEKISFLADRTRSSFDLTDSAKSVPQDYGRKGSNSPQSNQSSYPAPSVLPRSSLISSSTVSDAKNSPLSSPFETKTNLSPTSPISYSPVTSSYSFADQQNGDSNSKSSKTSGLMRATSFSGSTPFAQERSPTSNESPSGLQVSRTNSLASTFRPKLNEDARRSSLNQLIEQRRKSISKLRGLVIPEKDAVSVDQPIVDLPEIKSRDSILLRQIPKTNIQDKWGSQSSLASNTSTTSAPVKTTSFKMPAPQIHSKYSPAFKRKSLAVYTSTSSSGNSKNGQNSASPTTTQNSEPPKSLESICSPTRNDYSFEYASSSPEAIRTRPKTMPKKTRTEYDDSDNDSAVSSSQSSISRGCSPPMSPVPSERSTVSSERSYMSTEMNYQRGSLILDSPTRTYLARENIITEKERFSFRPNNLGYLPSEGSSSSSGSSHSRSPQPPETNTKNSQIPQRLTLKRSSSTETNCSTSSTLTSGSQASTESLSRRVLKPQSVEAINRKNILASARCRSGRDLNGSPLIQRKFPEDETTSSMKSENAANAKIDVHNNSGSTEQNIKIAYLEETDSFPEEDRVYEKTNAETKTSSKRSIPVSMNRFTKSDVIESSNDLRMWVRSEAKTLIKSAGEKPANIVGKNAFSQGNDVLNKSQNRQQERRNGSSDMSSEESDAASMLSKKTNKADNSSCTLGATKPKPTSNMVVKKDPEPNDLLTVLTTRSRSRSTIHVDSNTFNRSKSQVDLDDLLGGKLDPVLLRTQRNESTAERNGVASETQKKIEIIENHREKKLSESRDEEKAFVSKIPTLGKPRVNNTGNEKTTEALEKWRAATTRIPTTRTLGRRSASVTDMKKALEKGDVNSIGTNSTNTQHQSVRGAHNRFPSLDSSMEENSSPISTETETDRYSGEQFGSISSLASSTSLISQQELAQLVEEASLEEPRGVHDVIVVPLHKENPSGSVGITLAGGVDCEIKEITVHRVLSHSIADKDGRIQRGDRILSINGRSTRGLTHRESLAVLKQPRSEIVLVVSRSRLDEDCKLKTRSDSVETIVEALETNGHVEHTAWGPPATIAIYKDGAGLGFSLEGGRDSPLGDRPLLIKKIFTGGAAEKTGLLKAGDQLLEVNGSDVTRMSRIEAWSLMKKLHDGEVNLLVRHPATKST